MGAGHAHGAGVTNERRLWWAFGLTGTFMIAEVAGGVIFNSLALLSDAAHMFTDVAALGIALAAIRIGRRPVDAKRSFGYERFEILAAAFNTLLLFAVAAYIIVEGIDRFRQPVEIASGGMLVVATVGLIVNLVSMRLLAAGKDSSLNVKGAYLEVWSDLLGSLGVIVAAVAIMFTGWRWLDPVVAIAIGLWVLPRAWILLRDTANVLLQGTPRDIALDDVRRLIESEPNVERVHDLHVWSVTSGRDVLTAHVVIRPGAEPQTLLSTLTPALKARFGFFHTTLQLETKACDDMHGAHADAAADPNSVVHSHDDGAGHRHSH